MTSHTVNRGIVVEHEKEDTKCHRAVVILHQMGVSTWMAVSARRGEREVAAKGILERGGERNEGLQILPIKVYNTEMKNHYKRPSPPDLGWDDLRLDFQSFDGNNIETWNIDRCSEGQMMIIFQEMFVAATSYLRRVSQREIVDTLTTGFT
ncbi:polyprotein [Cucumis melo var. makuwa]|uniref:Polyprotein n=1 Tax=Cucumis melo var. makuwa TaxID=1194695 RepID=A0A5A7SXF6_CUCMM|nr:polyprotein [Cucumis melo var. makuwa]